MRLSFRLRLVLQVAAAAAAGCAAVAVLTPALLASRMPVGALIATLGAVQVGVSAAAGALLLFRHVATPVEEMLAAAADLSGGSGELPALGPPDEVASPSLARAAIAFQRTARALGAERERVAEQIAALERANAELARAQDSLVRTEKLATVGRLAAGLAHEIGNPLGAVTGYAELARERLRAGLSAEAGEHLARIAAEAQRIDGIVRDLLDFARPAETRVAPVALERPLEAALRLARAQPRTRDLAVSLELEPGLPPVWADEGRLAQVVLNLLLNAGDACGGRGEVRITGRRSGGGVLLEVADRGPGIAGEHLDRIFEPFFTTKPPGQGTGLGLSVCHGIVAALGGEIHAAHREGGGAVIAVRLRAAG